MVDILKSIRGKLLGLDVSGNLVIDGPGIIVNNGGTPITLAQSGSSRYVAAGATKTLTAADSGKVIKLDTLAGSVVTLPAATGTGAKFTFYVSVLATSNSHKIQVANATDFFIGTIEGVSDDPATVKGWIAANSGTVATNSDTITLNRSTTGSVSVGEWIEIEDVATATFLVSGMITQTGTEATPFTAAV